MKKQAKKKRVLILGGGFGGLHAALEFERKLQRGWQDLEVVLINKDNYSLFTPMLHEVATAELDPNSIVNPLHKMLRHVSFVAGKVTEIDLTARKVRVSQTTFLDDADDALLLDYDYLLFALGSTSNFFDLPGVEANSLTMKTLTDAVVLRNAVLDCFEAASLAENRDEQARLLTFVVAGGGFAGVETVGGLNDFAREAVTHYPNLSEEHLRVALVHADAELLPEFKGELSSYTREKLVERKVEVRLGARVAAANDSEILFADNTRMPAGLLVWTAGVKPNELIKSLPFVKEKERIVTNEFLEVPNFPGVWAIGDCAAVPDVEKNGFYPPLAQHAERQGKTAAFNILAVMRHKPKRAFRYRALGQLASIGYYSGVAKIFGWRFSGFPAWLLWRAAYLWKLPTLEKKLRVLSNWTLGALFARDVVQLLSKETLRVINHREKMFFDFKRRKLVFDGSQNSAAKAKSAAD